MTVRTPVKLDGTSIKEMSSSEIDGVIDAAIWYYADGMRFNRGGVYLFRSDTGPYPAGEASIGSIYDTRRLAGEASSDSTNFHLETETAEPTTASTTWDKIIQHVENTTASSWWSNDDVMFPIYIRSDGNLQTMSFDDVVDTFIEPAIDRYIASPTSYPSTYRVHSANTLTGYTLVNTFPVFADNRANVSLFDSDGSGIPEGVDQTITINNYYLFKKNHPASPPSFIAPLALTEFNGVGDTAGNWNIRETFTLGSDLGGIMEHYACEVDGYKIRYRYSSDGAGTNLGTGMADTVLNGSGFYVTNQVGDDYRAQEFPDGVPVTPNTYFLRVYKA